MTQNSNQKNDGNPFKKHGIVSIIFFLCLIVFIISLIFFKGKSFGKPIIWTSGILTVLNFLIAIGYQEQGKGYCEHCGKKLTHAEFTYQKGKASSSERRMRQNVRFVAVCRGCGKTKSIDHEFTISEIDINGWQKDYDIDKMAEIYIDKCCK